MIDVPEGLATAQAKYNGAAGRAFVEGLPALAAGFLERWELRLDGPSMHGWAALVLPVVRRDGTGAVLKLQILDAETEGEPSPCGCGTGTARCGCSTTTRPPARCSWSVWTPAACSATSRTPARPSWSSPASSRTSPRPPHHPACAVSATSRAACWSGRPEPWSASPTRPTGGWSPTAPPPCGRSSTSRATGCCTGTCTTRTSSPRTAPWIAIDPKPLAGDPGFDLLPALDNRYDPGETRWRFDALTDVLGLDRERARAWSLGRVLQNSLWNVEDGDPLETEQMEIGRLLRDL